MERATKDEEGEGGKADKEKPQTGLLKLRLAILVGLIHVHVWELYMGATCKGYASPPPPQPRLANIMSA